jgi:hypothetical protein
MHIFQGKIRKVLLCFCKIIPLISVNYFFFRSLYVDFESETTWKGLPAFRYVAGVHNFEAAKDFPPNICFCEDVGDELPECLEAGVLDLYNCLGNVLGFRNSMGMVLAFYT